MNSKRRRRIESALDLRRRTGLSWAALSERTGLPTSTLQYWDRRRRKAPRFVELAVAPERCADAATLEVALAQGHRVLVPRKFDPQHLRDVIAALVTEC